MSHKILIALLTVVVSLAIAACLPVPQVPKLPNIDPQKLFDTGRTYYNGGVKLETNLTQLRVAFEQKYSNFNATLGDLVSNNANCFTNVANAQATIAEAVTGTQTRESLFSALVTQSVSGEKATGKCADLNRQISDYVIANRLDIQNAYLAQFNGATNYQLYLSDFPEIQITNDLLTTYGDLNGVYKALYDHNIPGITDWTWLPTKNLKVIHSNRELCNYYMSGSFKNDLPLSMKRKFQGHEDSLVSLYESSWNNGTGLCTSTRLAAIDYMLRPFLTAEAKKSLESGTDSSKIPTVAPLVRPTPKP